MSKPRTACALLHCAGLWLAAGLASPQPAFAACSDNSPASNTSVTCEGSDNTGVQAPTASNVTVTVTSGASIETLGNPAINLGPAAQVTNSGTLSASGANTLQFSPAGDDTLTNSGIIGNSGGLAIDFGDGGGSDTFNMLAGSVSGQIEQRDGADEFNMSGGIIDSLDQGGGLDRAQITGGRIIGTLAGSDLITMTGGRVGGMDLRNGDNVVDLHGGQVDSGILTGTQNDTLRMSGGSVGNNVDLGRGGNVIELSGGAVGNQIITGLDRDSFTWTAAGTVGNSVQLGSGDDSATLNGVTTLGNTLLNGDFGNDSLQLNRQMLDNPARLQQWETIHLSANSSLLFDSNLLLGGADALPSQLIVDAGSRLLLPEMSAAIAAAADHALLVENNGSIDLRGTTANQLRIAGDYRGSGSLALDVILGGDQSLADSLQIDGGRASGSTQILFNKVGGNGAQTGNGILVVEALHGAATTADAFFMVGSLSAGPYEYFLFRGADAPAQTDNWYLRSAMLPGSAQPSAVAPTTSPAQTGAPLLVVPAPPAGKNPIPLYRPEIPLYAQAKSLSLQLSLLEIGSYHQRRGEQRNWSGAGNNTWLRLYYRDGQQDWRGDVYSRFDGHFGGFQLGRNVFASPSCTGAQELGLFVGGSRASGDVDGFARGFKHYDAGDNQLESYYFGGYFTGYKRDQSYLDLLFKVSHLELKSRSSRGINDRVDGPQLSVSVEKGFTLALGGKIGLEPQLQLVANYTNLSAYNDGISHVEPDRTPELSFRAGLRGYNRETSNQFYLIGNLWYTMDGDDDIQFDNRQYRLRNNRRASWAEIGGGLVLLERQSGSIYFSLSYLRSIDRLDWDAGSANLGFNWTW